MPQKVNIIAQKWPENRIWGLYEPENANFRPFLRFSRPCDMKSRKNESIEQGVAPYGAQGAPPVNADVHMAEGKSMGHSSPVFHPSKLLWVR